MKIIKKFCKWVMILTVIGIGSAICFLAIPLFVNWLLKHPVFSSIFGEEWEVGDALGYVGGVLTFIGTMFLGWVSWKQSRESQEKQDDAFIVDNACTALLDNVEFKGFTRKAANFQNHPETIAVTKSSGTSLVNYSTLECEVSLHHTKKYPVVVRVLEAILFVGNNNFDFTKYDNYFTRVAVGESGSRFNLTLVMSPEEKDKLVSLIKNSRNKIMFDMQIEMVGDRFVSTVLKCRSTLQSQERSGEFLYSSQKDSQMCFWYGNRIVEPSSIKYRN